jgi:glycosyltransferase involved in cell wall biosynthesis
MRIAFIGNLPASGVLPPEALAEGAGQGGHPAPWIVALLPELARITGYQLRVILTQRMIRRHALATVNGVEYEGIPGFPERLNRKGLYYPKSLLTNPALARFKPDLVHAFGFETGNALIAQRSGFPVSAFIQGIAELLEPYYGQRDWIDRKVGVWGERKAVPHIRWMVGENEFAKEWAISKNAQAQVKVIPHPTREDFFEKAAPIYGRSLLTVGGLDDRKGMDTIIRAFALAQVPDCRLVVTGGGPLKGVLQQLANDLGMGGQVEFTGSLGTAEVIARMNAARAFVIGSRMDTSPNVVSEAHAIGLPVIGTKVGGIPEMIEEGVDGYLVDRDDVSAMAERMSLLLKDEPLARSLGQAGRAKVRALNDANSVAEAHAEFFSRIGRELGVAGA